MTTLTIAIPTFERSGYLEESLKAIALSIQGFEDRVNVIISDNASQDDTKSVVEMYQSKYRWISMYHRNQENVVIDNFYIAGSLCESEYLWLLGDDDTITKDSIENILHEIDEGADAILLNYRQMDITLSHVLVNGAKHRVNKRRELFTKNDILAEFGIHLGFISSLILRKEYMIHGKNIFDAYKDYYFPHVYAVYRGLPDHLKFIYLNDIHLNNRTGNYGEGADVVSYKGFVEGPNLMFKNLLQYGYSVESTQRALEQVFTDYFRPAYSLLDCAMVLSKNEVLKAAFLYSKIGNWNVALPIYHFNYETNKNEKYESYFWDFNEHGNVFSEAMMGLCFEKLGGKESAIYYYELAFNKNPQTHPSLILPLVSRYNENHQRLDSLIESRIQDCAVFESYLKAAALYESERIPEIRKRFEVEYGESSVLKLVTMQHELVTRKQDLNQVIKIYNDSESLYYIVLFLLNLNALPDKEGLSMFGPKGNAVLHCIQLEQGGLSANQLELNLIFEDLVVMKLENLLFRWLPFSTHVDEYIAYLRYTPLVNLVFSIKWLGNTAFECLCNAERELRNGNIGLAQEWSNASLRFGVYVWKYEIDCKIENLLGNYTKAKIYQEIANKLFPGNVEFLEK